MSRIYFHSPSGDAELRGSERAWLGHVARGPARAAWDLDAHANVEKMAAIIALIPEVDDGPHGANYLHTYLREAQAAQNRRRDAYGIGITDQEPRRKLLSALQTRLDGAGGDTIFRVGEVDLGSYSVALNTALAAGSPVIQLAAKIDGWCEVHAWVDGPDRNWLATLIDDGLRAGIYRSTLKGYPMGWEDVQKMLRDRNDEPVVMSYSVCDQFPSPDVAGWDDDRRDEWYELPDNEQWAAAIAGLRNAKPWAQITPDNLGDTTFGPGVTVYDLLAADRDARVQAAVAREETS